MNKKTEPKYYAAAYIAGKLAGGKTAKIAGVAVPIFGVRDGAGQERIREWIVNILETTNDDDLSLIHI